MKLDRLPRFSLAEFPTPIHYLENLTKACQGPSIYMKRDDLTSLGMGGNKTRKLEFLVGQALADGADTLVTASGIQSNHCRLTAAAACRAGLACDLVLNGTAPQVSNGNLLLDKIFKAQVHFCDRKDRDAQLFQVADDLAARGKKPFVIPVGGSNGIGSVGYVTAMIELKAQLAAMALAPAAIDALAQHEGILLGPVYTARAMGGLLDLIQKKIFTRNQSVLFWHTGGTPELFAWADRFLKKKR